LGGLKKDKGRIATFKEEHGREEREEFEKGRHIKERDTNKKERRDTTEM